MEVKFTKLVSNAIAPSRGSEEAAGYDLAAVSAYDIMPGGTVKIKTGLAIALPSGTFGAIFARSGLATKKGLRPANCVGVIDSDYRGEIIVALHNDSDAMQSIEYGDRIAQLVILPYVAVDFKLVDSLDETERGVGGFGSTGV